MPALVDVLLPTCNRACALAVTLASLAAQDFRSFRIIISDQSDPPGALQHAEVQAVIRYLRHRGREVTALTHLPRRGMAEQRAFLLSHVDADACLFLDDDVLLEPDLIARLHRVLREQGCGFVGSALHGLSFQHDERPHQQAIEFWDGPVQAELIQPGDPAWQRHHLHSAANLLHVQQKLASEPAADRVYKVAWVGGCVLYDTQSLRRAGGFEFWRQLPEGHCGEDVLAQLRVMQQDGGCALFPSGAYHMELPTTVTTRLVDAPKVLPVALEQVQAT